MMSKIVVVGSLNMDLVLSVPRIPEIGETISGSGFQMIPGGKGANQAFAAAKAGAQVLMIGRVGNDEFAGVLRRSLVEAGVDVTAVLTTTDISTGVAMITVCNGNNSIMLNPGSNNEITIEDIERYDDALLDADAIMLQLEIPMQVVKYVIKKYKNKTKIFLNPAPAQSLPDNLLDGLDYLLPNEIEARQISGIDTEDEAGVLRALEYFLTKGVCFPIITLGERGVAFYDGSKNCIMPAIQVEAVDSSAAGDTFAGAFTQCICYGDSIDDAVRYAQAAAALAVMRKGAQSSIPSREEVAEFLHNVGLGH